MDFILKGIVLLYVQFCLSFCLYLDADIGGSSRDLCASTVCKLSARYVERDRTNSTCVYNEV